jgi:hypothetical protein
MRVRRYLICAALSLSLAGAAAQAAQATSSSGSPKATEVGVTPTTIHVAVIADVDTPLAPGLFQGVVDGARAAAKYLNGKSGGGGLAGRKLVVDFIDSKLNPTTARNAVISACGQDFAMVSTAALFLTTMDDAVSCKDQAGATTGLPDVAAVAGTTEGCTDISFPVNPPNVLCDTRSKTPQTYQSNQGAFRYLLTQHKQGLHGATIYGNDTKQGAAGGQVLIDAALHAGVKADQQVGVSGAAPQSAYTPIIQKMRQDNSNFAYNTSAASGAIELMSEAQLQGLTDPNIVWTCTTACYDKSVKASAATDNLYVPMNFLPFEEASSNKMLANFLRYVGPSKASGFAVYGWTSTLAFAQGVRAAAAKAGVDGLTRSSLLAGMKTVTSFDAGGMTGKTDIANKIATPCTLLMQLRNGKWTRIWPSKKGTFDCTKSNYVEIHADFGAS